MVWNLTTGFISPQFHVIFDNWFETVSLNPDKTVDPDWDLKFTQNFNFDGDHHKIPIDDKDCESFELDDNWLTPEEILEKRTRLSLYRPRPQHLDFSSSKNPLWMPTTSASPSDQRKINNRPIKETIDKDPPYNPESPTKFISPSSLLQTPISSLKTHPLRPLRNQKTPKRYGFDGTKAEYNLFQYDSQLEHVMGLMNSTTFEPFLPLEYANLIQQAINHVPD